MWYQLESQMLVKEEKTNLSPHMPNITQGLSLSSCLLLNQALALGVIVLSHLDVLDFAKSFHVCQPQ